MWNRDRDEIVFTVVPGTNAGNYAVLITLSDGDETNEYSFIVLVEDDIPFEDEDETGEEAEDSSTEENGASIDSEVVEIDVSI